MGVVQYLVTLFLVGQVLGFIPVEDFNFEKHERHLNILEKVFEREYVKYLETGKVSHQLQTIYDALPAPKSLARANWRDLEPNAVNFACIGCRIIAPAFMNLRRKLKLSNKVMKKIVVDYCTRFKLEKPKTCQTAADMHLDTILYIVDNEPELIGHDFCAINMMNKCGFPKNPSYNISFPVDTNAPPITDHKSQISDGKNNFKIIHITDIHYERRYIIGGNTNCGEETCCRNNQEPAEDPKYRAGRWGDYHCDTPYEVAKSLLKHIKSEHPDAQMIYYTGDTVDHGVWETSQDGNVESVQTIIDLFKAEFNDLPVLHTVGNHEGHPVNCFAPENFTHESLSMSYLYDTIKNGWTHWLPESTKETINRGAYYTFLARPGFRIIVLNNNMCYTTNWWIMYKFNTVITPQLQWLHDTLLEAEANNEIVHILAHMPAGADEQYTTCAREFHKIIDRFHRIIPAQFNGHSHYDEFHLYYAREGGEQYAIHVGWNGGSATSHYEKNPNYRVYYVDKETYEVNEAITWYYNLTEANLTPDVEPDWKVLYSFKEEYKLPDLSPRSLDGLVHRLAKEKELLKRYTELRHRRADASLAKECNDSCLRRSLCYIVTNIIGDERKCNSLLETFDYYNRH